MATSFTYSTLKQFIKDGVEDQGTTFDGVVDTIIKLGEDRILRDLPLAIFESRDQNVALVAGTQTAAKPSNTVVTHELYYIDANSQRVTLLPRTRSFCLAYCPDTTQRTPKYFDDGYSETEYFISPVPNVTVTAKADVTKRPASIVTATTTFLGTNVGDLLLASCMISAEQFNLGWAEAKDWGATYVDKLTSARVDLRHLLRRDYATLAPQPMAAGKGER